MCRNIKTLFNFDPPVTAAEIQAASLQFVRKISGCSKPSRANEASFLAAVDDIAEIIDPSHSCPRNDRSTEESRRTSRKGQGSRRFERVVLEIAKHGL